MGMPAAAVAFSKVPSSWSHPDGITETIGGRIAGTRLAGDVVAHRFEHILVPVALGPRPARLLDIARGLAVDHEARLTLIHVVHAVPELPTAEMRTFYAKLRRRSHEHLERLAEDLHDVDARVVVTVGDPAAHILAHVNKRKVDLVVIGSHRLARRPGHGLGTISYRVAIQCGCAVMLVK